MKRTEYALIAVAASVLLAGVGCGDGGSAADGGADGETVATAAAVVEIMNANCMPCHAGADAQEELALDSIEGLMAGSEHGAMVVPGDAATSQLIKNLRGDGAVRMPYLKDPLAEADIKLIEDWINAGAATS